LSSFSGGFCVKLFGMRRRRHGVTIIETILCLGLITVAALGLIAALTRLMVAQSSSSHQTVARIIADTRLQKALISGPETNWDPVPPPEDGDAYLVGDILTESVRVGQEDGEVEFFYQIVAPVEAIAPPLSFQSGESGIPDMGRMYKVTIRVWWNADDTGPQSAVERGTQTIEVTALTYIED
jgi:hypothetical protein